MSYTQQDFQNGQVLKAEHLEELEIGILEAEFCDQENTIKILTIPAGEIEGTTSYKLTKGSGPYAAIIPCSELAKTAFSTGSISSSVGNHNYGSIGTQVRTTFDLAEVLPWRSTLKVKSFEYARGSTTITLKEAVEEDVSYICIFAKEESAEVFLGDMIIDTLNPLLIKVDELEQRLMAIEDALQ